MAYIANDPEESNNRKLITKEAQRDAASYVVNRFESRREDGRYDPSNIKWLLGAVDEIEDFYWIFLNNKLELEYESCVGGYDVLSPEDLTQPDGQAYPIWAFFDYWINEAEDEEKTKLENRIKEKIASSIISSAQYYFENVKKHKGAWKKVSAWERVEKYYTNMINDPFNSKGVLHFQMWPNKKEE